jgi:AraC family transcriptional regulator
LAKVAVDLRAAVERRWQSGEPGRARSRVLARGEGWSVADVVCTSGPRDRSFEEQHTQVSIALVLDGSFQYRTANGAAVMTPGAAMLGMPGLCYECGHEHGDGDRCVAFWYAPHVFERIAADAGVRGSLTFSRPRIPAIAALAPMVAAAGRGVSGGHTAWHELAVTLAASVIAIDHDRLGAARPPPHAEARASAAVRLIDAAPDLPHTLETMATAARVSPYHFLRSFQQVTGVTPHQYVLRARLRAAAWRLTERPSVRILDIALDAGFGDASNFDHAFRREFGLSPRAYRQRYTGGDTTALA